MAWGPGSGQEGVDSADVGCGVGGEAAFGEQGLVEDDVGQVLEAGGVGCGGFEP